MSNISTVSYKMSGTCSRKLDLVIEDGIIRKCSFDRGCTGNLLGISQLVIGQQVDHVIDLLLGINCQNGTSCPDQLARALIEYKREHDMEAKASV